MAALHDLHDWLNALAAAAPLENAHLVSDVDKLPWALGRGVVAAVEGDARLGRWSVRVRVGVSHRFPNQLPHVQLVRRPEVFQGCRINHLERNQGVCFTATREVVINRTQPVQVLRQSLYRALRTLKHAWTRPQDVSFFDEFSAYWSAQHDDPLLRLRSFITVDSRLREVLAWRAGNLQRSRSAGGRTGSLHYKWVADDAAAPSQFAGRTERQPESSALYLPLDPDRVRRTPEPSLPWSVTALRRYVRATLTLEDLAELDRLLVSRNGTQDLVVLAMPRPGGTGVGTRTLVALHLRGMRRGHALSTTSDLDRAEANPLEVQRLERAFVMQRGGSHVELANRRVLLIGCGAIGGHLAFALAAAGVGHLTLVDNDVLSEENTFRHALGRAYVGKSKVRALGHELTQRFPYLEIGVLRETSDVALDDGQLDLTTFDLVIGATGDPTTDLDLNERLRALHTPPTALFTWLEPLGVGGHALTLVPGYAGCVACLYTDHHHPLHSRAALVAAGQEFKGNEVGCGSAYTPFADLDARRSAEMAARQAVELLEGRANGSMVFTWKGDARAFLDAGHRLAPRFTATQDELGNGHGFASVDCPVCGGRP
ncbi:ThiF family adenylyltransferase [Deinococcus petrolearius]|uniref:ThiF family adenylyltransferase n=1 Tax=Deinococcus petrolearius TaxID=1751295 RepID=UPI0036D3197D